jgi:hypothetical protein
MSLPDTYTVELELQEVMVVEHALRVRLNQVEMTLPILAKADQNKLSAYERAILPETMADLTDKEVGEQYNPWITLRDMLIRLIDEFDADLIGYGT